MLSRNRVDLKPYNKEVIIKYEEPKLLSSPYEMPNRHTDKHTDTEKIHTSSHPTPTKTHMVHTKMAHTNMGPPQSSSQTNRHDHIHSPKCSPPKHSPATLSSKIHQPSASLGNSKGATPADQKTSSAAKIQINQSPTECNSKGKRDLKFVKLPCKTRSGRSVRAPERYRD